MKGKAKSEIRLIAVVSDIHCGSSVGLLPPGFVLAEGQEIGQSKRQKWLWQAWTDTWNRFYEYAGDEPFALVVNGDIIEGVHHGTKQVISPDANDHLEAAVATLKPIADKAAKVFITDGTECHSANTEQKLGKILNAVPDPNTGRRSWDRLTSRPAVSGLCSSTTFPRPLASG